MHKPNTSSTKRAQVDEAFADATNATMRRTHWCHHVAVQAIRNGVDANWLTENFAKRMVVWFNAGETVRGAVEMLAFSWRETQRERAVSPELRDVLNAIADATSPMAAIARSLRGERECVCTNPIEPSERCPVHGAIEGGES
jgi:hypothetical protein